MACEIIIRSVNIMPGNPQRLRVVGFAPGCDDVVLETSNPVVTAQPAQQWPVDGNGFFVIETQLTVPLACNAPNPPTVIVRCAAGGCSDQWAGATIACCDISLAPLEGGVALGDLQATAIVVKGSAFGCDGDAVTIESPIGAFATAASVPVDPATGAFTAACNLVTPLVCGGDPIEVVASCASDPTGCRTSRNQPIECPQCFRAHLDAQVGPCTGVAPAAPVHITAAIGLLAGERHEFRIDFGDGQSSQTFTVPPVGTPVGGLSDVYTHSEPAHSYAPGTYTIRLRSIDLGADNCPPVTKVVTIDCSQVGCPQANIKYPTGDCEPAGALLGTRKVSYEIDFTPPLAAGWSATADFAYGTTEQATMTTATTGTSGANPSPTSIGPAPSLLHHGYFLPGTWTQTAFVTINDATGVEICAPQLPVTLDVAPCAPCPKVTIVVTPSLQAGLPVPHVRLEAQLVPPMPVPAGGFDWNVTAPDGHTVAQISGGPGLVTTQNDPGWHWQGAGADTNGVILTAGGVYTVSVLAKYAAGLLPDDCVLNSPAEFTVVGPPSPCPGIDQVTVSPTPPACIDPPAGAGSSVVLTVVASGAGTSGYTWVFGDGSSSPPMTPASVHHTYTHPGSFPVTVTPDPTRACPTPKQFGLTVDIPACPCPPGQSRATPTSPCTPTTSGPGSGNATFSCAVLLWLGIMFSLVGLIVLIVGCFVGHAYAPAGEIIQIVGAALLAIGVILLFIWWILCRLFTACQVILAARDLVIALIAIFALAAVIILIVSHFFPVIKDCLAYTALSSAYWGGLLAILDKVAQAKKCLIVNPSG